MRAFVVSRAAAAAAAAVVVVVQAASGCGGGGGGGEGDAEAGGETGGSDADVAPEGSDGDAGGEAEGGGVEDGGPQDPCGGRCGALAECGEDAVAACARSCGRPLVVACEDTCLAAAADCDAKRACVGAAGAGAAPAGEVAGTPAAAFSEGPYGTGFYDTVGPLEIGTVDGTFDLEQQWTGRESFLFAVTQTGFPPGEELWQSSVQALMSASPANVQYVFMAYRNPNLADDVEAVVLDLKARIDEAAVKYGDALGRAEECRWRRNTWFVPVSAWDVGGWLGPWLQGDPQLSFGIDRFQRLRQGGLLSLVQGTSLLYHLQFEARRYDVEVAREAALAADEAKGVTVVTVLEGEEVSGKVVDVELPAADVMAGFDTLVMDLRQECKGRDDRNCFEWDYNAWFAVRERPEEESNGDAATPCQPAVEADPEGGVEAVPAATLPCTCLVPGGGTRESAKSCLAGGAGFGECACTDQLTLGRWITTYHREGRWVADLSPLLPLLAAGGTTRFAFEGAYPYVSTLHLRFHDAGKAVRPKSVVRLFGGGGFYPGSSAGYAPLEVAVPPGTKKAELFAYITGHGQGGTYNCAEFCAHEHTFSVGGEAFVQDQPFLGDFYGCAWQVESGAIPNQFGTWTIGRGGWCPGMDVKPFRPDVTAAVEPGGTATFTYANELAGWKEGMEPYGGEIWMSSYVVFYE